MKICWAQSLFIVIVIILGVGNILSACGQKGPLHLPDDSAQTEPQKQKKSKD
jgi:predicted small lipoprotein YifL